VSWAGSSPCVTSCPKRRGSRIQRDFEGSDAPLHAVLPYLRDYERGSLEELLAWFRSEEKEEAIARHALIDLAVGQFLRREVEQRRARSRGGGGSRDPILGSFASAPP